MPDHQVIANLTAEDLERLEFLKKRAGMNGTDCIRQALATEQFVTTQIAEGSHFLVTGRKRWYHRLMGWKPRLRYITGLP